MGYKAGVTRLRLTPSQAWFSLRISDVLRKTQTPPFLRREEQRILTRFCLPAVRLASPREGLRDLWFFPDSRATVMGEVDPLVGPEYMGSGREPAWGALG